MQIFNKLKDVQGTQKCIIALGNFDGIHIGHQEIIKKAVVEAREEGCKSAIFTFSNHPRRLLNTELVKNILYPEDKIEIVANIGVDYYFDVPFTEDIMKLSADEFIKDILIDTLKVKGVICGFNYKFGYKGEGDVAKLIESGKDYGYDVHVISPVTVNGTTISSSLIRQKIASGKMISCKKYLGRNYSIGGMVVVGNRLGKTIGFPTSNLNIDNTMVSPPNGVYRTLCLYNGTVYPSITNVGQKPTIGKYMKNIETHIFDFDKELYGKEIRVEFLEKMRDEVKFDSIAELSEAIKKDCRKALELHAKEGRLNINK